MENTCRVRGGCRAHDDYRRRGSLLAGKAVRRAAHRVLAECGACAPRRD